MSGVDLEEMKERLHLTVSSLDSRFFSDEYCRKLLREHFHVNTLEGLGLADYEAGTIAAGAVLQYLYETQKTSLAHMTAIRPYTTVQYLSLIHISFDISMDLVATPEQVYDCHEMRNDRNDIQKTV